MSMSFCDIAWWKSLSIWLIAYRSDSRCRASSEAGFELDPPQAETATTRIPSTQPINSVRMSLVPPSLAARVMADSDVHTPASIRLGARSEGWNAAAGPPTALPGRFEGVLAPPRGRGARPLTPARAHSSCAPALETPRRRSVFRDNRRNRPLAAVLDRRGRGARSKRRSEDKPFAPLSRARVPPSCHPCRGAAGRATSHPAVERSRRRYPRHHLLPRSSGARQHGARRVRASGSSRCRRRSARAGQPEFVCSWHLEKGRSPPYPHRMLIRVVLAEDQYLVREGLRRLLETRKDLEVASVCSDLESLLATVEAEQPDVVVTDIRMPPGNTDEGIQAATRLRDTNPEVGVVVLSQYAIPRYVLALLEGGSERRAYLLKERVDDLDQLVAAIHAVAAGGSVFDPKVVEALVAENARSEESPLNELTPRERDVLREMAEGKNNAAIARALVLSERSVEKVIHSIFLKLGLRWETEVHKRVKAVVFYLAESN